MLELHYTHTDIPFQDPFTISKATKTTQPALVVSLTYFGVTGYGEAPAISYYNVTVEGMIQVIEAKKRFIEKFAFSDPERYWHYLHHLLPAHPFLVAALDMAAWDLFGKLRRKPLWQLWNLDPGQMPITDYTIGIDTIDRMVEKLQAKPWPLYKIKVGTDGDIERIQALRQHTEAPFVVDANGGWNLEEAQAKIPQLQSLGVQWVEQPLPREAVEDMRLLKAASALPLIADESCIRENEVALCAELFHGINIKLTKCSGITPARRMIQEARKLNLQVMLGCMNEASIGSAAVAHLAPLADWQDNDGTLLLAGDNAAGFTVEHAKPVLQDAPGLGVQPTVF